MVSVSLKSLATYTVIFELVCILIAATVLTVDVQCSSWPAWVRFSITMLIQFGVMSYAIATGIIHGNRGTNG